MNSFTLLYLFYCAKIGCQAGIYFIWLADSTSRSIAFLAAAVAVFAIFPFFHVIVHIFSAKPLSNPTFIAYLCSSLLLAILWYKPTQDGKHGVLPFGLVTTFDLLAFLIFLFQRQIYHWRGILTSDIEQGHLKAANIDDASVRLVGGDNEQVEHRDPAARPETPRSEIRRLQVIRGLGYDIDAINRSGRDIGSSVGSNTVRGNPRSVVGGSGGPVDVRGLDERLGGGGAAPGGASGRFAGTGVAVPSPGDVGWTPGMLQGVSEGQGEMEEGQQERASGFLIDRGANNFDAGSGFENIHSPPAIIVSSDVHPALRYPFDDTYQPESYDSFRTPKQAPGSPGKWMLERNQFEVT